MTNERTQDTVTSVDDFAEFLQLAYLPLLEALSSAGLRGTAEPGLVGSYLFVVRPAEANDDHIQVEVTDDGKPLPAQPSDVTRWLLTCGRDHRTLSPTASFAEVAAEASTLLARH